jgi:hypothetical protein
MRPPAGPRSGQMQGSACDRDAGSAQGTGCAAAAITGHSRSCLAVELHWCSDAAVRDSVTACNSSTMTARF